MAFTELGTNRPEFNYIADYVKQLFKDKFGSAIDVDDPTVAGQLAGVLTSLSDTLAQTIEGGFNSLFVLKAKGNQLNDIGAEWGIYRKPASPSYLNEVIDCYVDSQNPTQIPEDSDFSTADGQVFHTLGDLTFDEPTATVDPKTGYVSFMEDQDGHELCRQTVQCVSDLAGDDQNVTSNSVVNADDVDGLLDCFNPTPAVGGLNAETDSSLRQRILNARTSSPKFSDNGIIDDIRNLSGVRDVKLIDNREMKPDKWGDPAKSIHLYTVGGDDGNIAQELFNHLYPTTKTTGSIHQEVTADDGTPYQINFDHAQALPIQIQLTIKVNPDEFNADTVIPNIQQNVADYFSTLNMGDTVLYSRMFNCAYLENSVNYVAVKIGTDSNNLSMQDIHVDPFQLATASANSVDVEVKN